MAKKESSGSGEKPNSQQNTKLADIYTAAKSTMEPCAYEKGYPPPEGVLRNMNFSGKKG